MKLIQVSNNRKEIMDLLQDHKDEVLIVSLKENENFIVLSDNILNNFIKEFKVLVPEVEFEYIFDEFTKMVKEIKPMLIGRSDYIY